MIYQIDIIKKGSGRKCFTVSGNFDNRKNALELGQRLVDYLKIEDAGVIVSYGLGDEIIQRLDKIIKIMED